MNFHNFVLDMWSCLPHAQGHEALSAIAMATHAGLLLDPDAMETPQRRRRRATPRRRRSGRRRGGEPEVERSLLATWARRTGEIGGGGGRNRGGR